MRQTAILAALILVLGCEDGKPTSEEGTLTVRAGGRTILTVAGGERTTLELDGRGSGSLDVRIGDGPSRPFGPAESFRRVFDGSLTVVITNGADEKAALHYRVKSEGGLGIAVEEESR